MTHTEKRAEWYKEGLFSMITGFLYGATNTIVGHPFDTIKTKMQAQPDFISADQTYVQSIKKVYQNDGFIGYYRGCIPPLIGSIIFRSLQFSAFEAVFTKCETIESMKQTIPYSGGIQYRIILGGMASATCRAVVECPFEYAKVKRQTGQTYKLIDGYTGFGIVYLRTMGLMTSFFVMLDTLRRNTNIFHYKIGQFFASGTAAMVAFWIVWPLETLKNQAQAGASSYGNSTISRMFHIIQKNGIAGLYRGIIPGSQSVFLRNGSAMIVMQYAQKKLTEKGFRD